MNELAYHLDSFIRLLTFLTLGLPLFSFILCQLIPDKYSWLAPIVATLLVIASAVCGISLLLSAPIPMQVGVPWLKIGEQTIRVGILLDRTALVMLVMVVTIAALIHIFSIGYMSDDKRLRSYFGMLGFFTFVMSILVVSSNLLQMFFFWELVGFSSYRLIGHWQENPKASAASYKAFIMNRVGDLGFIVGLMILWSSQGSFELSDLNSETHALTIAFVCLFVGVVAKSAQFPLFTWLPDAMEGPTPVSAMIHAATMVAAGVFLLLRLSPHLTPTALMIIGSIGAITSLLGAIAALFQFDIKKLLAYSTISQLGWMMMAIGSGAYEGAFLHLLNHAFFKAGLFLMAGSIIHSLQHVKFHSGETFDEQDIRNMGGLRKQMPVTFWVGLICAGALAGLPFTSGFVSKEIILTHVTQTFGNSWLQNFIAIVGWIVTFLTPLYTFRLLWYVFFGPSQKTGATEVPGIMQLPMIVLSLASLGILISFSPLRLSGWLDSLIVTGIHSNLSITFLSVMVILSALFLSYYLFKGKPNLSYPNLFYESFYLDRLYHFLITSPTHWLSKKNSWLDTVVVDGFLHFMAYLQVTISHLVSWMDNQILDGFFVNGSAKLVTGVGSATRSMVAGKIQSYLVWALAGLVIFIFWILLR